LPSRSGAFQVPPGCPEAELLDRVYADERLAALAGPRDRLRKVIHIPDKILNLV